MAERTELPEPLSEAQLAEIQARVEATTPGPWVIERSVSQAHNAQEVHWSVRTRDTLPEHPWSPRYVLWMTGLLWEARDSHEPHMRWCEACRHMHYDFREVPVDVRSDPAIEADAAFIAHAREDVPALLAEIERLRANVERYKNALASGALVARKDAQGFEARDRQIAAMLPVVRAVAEADNSDSSVCYQICNVRWYGGETDTEELEMRHDAPCIVEQAQTSLAEGGDLLTAPSSAAGREERKRRDGNE